MPNASYVQSSFLGGVWSKTAQGRIDDPVYTIALSDCLNGLPLEAGAWTRRPGTRHAGPTRAGAPGRVIGLNLKQAQANTLEFTDGHLQIRQGPTLITQNDSVGVTSISTASPAVMLLASARTWATGDRGYFTGLGTSCPLLQNRRFTLTKSDTTHFSLADELTGTAIDGATLGVASLAAGATFNRVLDIATPYVAGSWANLRSVQTDIKLSTGTTPGTVLFNPSFTPYVLQVATAPTDTAYATFTLAAANIKDGPYLDPVAGGTLATPSATIGNITVTLSFNAYDATRSYSIGDYVTSGGNNYKSLVDANLGSAPPSANWTAVSGADAIGPNGFQGSDVGRHVRVFSEPALYDIAHGYSAGDIVAYGGQYPQYIGATYWKALAGSTGVIPGTDTTKWAIAPNAARWTWGKITALSNIISRATGANIGNMTSGGGLAAAFDGILSQAAAASAEQTSSGGPGASPSTTVQLNSYVGKDYSAATDQAIQQAIVYPSTDSAVVVSGTIDFGASAPPRAIAAGDYVLATVYNLRGKASAPANSSDGTLLGTTGVVTTAFTVQQTIASGNTATAWKYGWVEQATTVIFSIPGAVSITYAVSNAIAELSLFNPPGSGTSTGFTLQIIGDPLLYTTAIRVWRPGIFSATTGYPTVGTYHEDGRLWLSGAIPNRIDGSRSNDPFNFAPTDPDGSVPDNAAITYRFNAKDINPIVGMDSDERGIICRTQNAEWLVTATTQNLALSVRNIQAHPVTYYGSESIEARRAGGVLVFVRRFSRQLLEYFSDVISGRQIAPNLTRDALHLTVSGIAELAHQSMLSPILWARRNDGTLVGTTYKRENLNSAQGPAFNGWHRHTLGSGRVVESICAGPSVGGDLDALTLVTNDEATGVRHVEVLTDLWDEGNELTDAWYLDNAAAPSSFTYDLVAGTLTLNGLWHLNGASVAAFVAGIDAGDYTVTNGSITVPIDGTANSSNGTSMLTADRVQPYLGGTLPAVIGFDYNSDGQVLPPGSQKGSGAATGPAMGKVDRDAQIAVRLVDTIGGYNGTTAVGISFGSFFTSDSLLPALTQQDDETTPNDAVTLFNGLYWAPVNNPYSRDRGQLCWRANRGYPATIAALGGFKQTMD